MMRSFARMLGCLDDRAVIAVSGPEAKSFLQGLITNDIAALAPDAPIYAALLTPQGKILFDFIVSEKDGGVLLDCAAASAEALMKRLSMYRLRSRVDLSLRTDLAVFWRASDEMAGIADPRLHELGRRSVGARDASAANDRSEYLSRRLDLGVPEGEDFGSDKTFALDAGLEELNGVSFSKGCYIGQELTARMKHRGTARKRLLLVATKSGDLPPPGTGIRTGALSLGEIVSVYDARGFGLIRLDRWQEPGDASVRAGEQDIRIVKPAWLTSGKGS
jgi:tRNA-modifying protein YgfZ